MAQVWIYYVNYSSTPPAQPAQMHLPQKLLDFQHLPLIFIDISIFQMCWQIFLILYLMIKYVFKFSTFALSYQPLQAMLCVVNDMF